MGSKEFFINVHLEKKGTNYTQAMGRKLSNLNKVIFGMTFQMPVAMFCLKPVLLEMKKS